MRPAALALLAAVLGPATLGAQASEAVPFWGSLVPPGLGQVPRTAESSLAGRARVSGRCLSLRVIPGDTAGRTMPRTTGDTLTMRPMPRMGASVPACDSVRPARSAVALPDSLRRWLVEGRDLTPVRGPATSGPPPR